MRSIHFVSAAIAGGALFIFSYRRWRKNQYGGLECECVCVCVSTATAGYLLVEGLGEILHHCTSVLW